MLKKIILISFIAALAVWLVGFSAINTFAEGLSFALVADPQFSRPECGKNAPVDEDCLTYVEYRNESVVNKIREINSVTPLKWVVLLGDLTENRSFVYFSKGPYSDGCGWLKCTEEFNSFRDFYEYPPKYGENRGKIGIPTFIGLGNHDLRDYWGDTTRKPKAWYDLNNKCSEANIWKYVLDRFDDGDALPPIPDVSVSIDPESKAYSWNWYDSDNRQLHLVHLHVPDWINETWLTKDLNNLPDGTPVILFQHLGWNGQPSVEIDCNWDWLEDPTYFWGKCYEKKLGDIVNTTNANVIAAFHGHGHCNGQDTEDPDLHNNYLDQDVPIFSVGSAGWHACCDGQHCNGRKFGVVHVELSCLKLQVRLYNLDAGWNNDPTVHEVSYPNNPPDISQFTGAVEVEPGQESFYQFAYSDPDNDDVDVEVSCDDWQHSGFLCGEAWCHFYCNFTYGPCTPTVSAVVTDSCGNSVVSKLRVTVKNVPPIVNTPVVSPKPSDEGEGVTVAATFGDVAIEGDLDHATCTIDYGDGSKQEGKITKDICTGPEPLYFCTGTCTGNHIYSDNGSYTVTVSVTDKDEATGSNSTSHWVNNVPPIVNTPVVSPKPSDEGEEVTVSATFSDVASDMAGAACKIYYGDGSDAKPGTITGNTCTGTHIYGDNGSYTVTVDVTDKDGAKGTNSTILQVNNRDPIVDLPVVDPEPSYEGEEVTVSATFSDVASDMAGAACKIYYGDGSDAKPGTITGNTCTGTHIYGDNCDVDSYTVYLVVTDKDEATGSNSTYHWVNNVVPTVNKPVVPANPYEGMPVTVSATFSDVASDMADSTCRLYYGDGSGPKSGTITGITCTNEYFCTGTCTGTHIYSDNGSYTVTVNVTDKDHMVGTNNTSLEVINMSPTLEGYATVVPEPSYEGEEVTVSASFRDVVSDMVGATCTIKYGDGSGEQEGTITDINCTDEYFCIETCTGTHTYLDNTRIWPYSVNVVLKDKDNGQAESSVNHAVTNVDPVASINRITDETGNEIPEDAPAALVGLSVNGNGSFTDAGTLDTHTATWDWVDETITEVTVTEEDGSDSVEDTHTYAVPGVYTITLSVTDDDGGEGKATAQIEVVNPEDYILSIVEDLNELVNDIPGIQDALDALIGNEYGQENNGALDKILGGDLNSALVKIREALGILKATDSSIDLTVFKKRLTLTAKCITVGAINERELLANEPWEQELLQSAKDLVEEGDVLWGDGDYIGAVNKYQDALQKLVYIS